MPLRALSLDDLWAVARDMREADRREIFATRFDEDALALAEDLMASEPVGAIVAAADGAAVAALGGIEMWPCTWSLWMFATERWPEVAKETTRFAKSVLWPALLRLGLKRGECRSAVDHETAHRWLSFLGGDVEAFYPAYGKGGETFVGFVIYGEMNMCAVPQKRRRLTTNSGESAPAASIAPAGDDMVADAAAEKELRRLRSLYGRRATILTPDRAALGQAPVVQKNLLGS